MIIRRSQQLTQFAGSLRKRDFGGAARALGIAKNETQRLGKKSYELARKEKTRRFKTVWDKQAVKPATFANNFLEYSFGWVPLVTDILDAAQVLGREFPSGPVKGVAKDTVATVDGIPNLYGIPGVSALYVYEQLCVTRLQALVRVSNPNVLLASELGLINPAQVAWNVIPYSFLIDSMLPVGRFLGSFSDFAGVELVDAFQSRLTVSYSSRTVDWIGLSGRGKETSVARGVQHKRELLQTFEVPSLKSRIGLPVGNLLGRAATSVALLVQQLTKGK